MLKKYAVVIQKSENNFSAEVPDLPGCTATGNTLEELQQMMQQAIKLHLEQLRQKDLPIPEPTTRVGFIEVEFAKGGGGNT